MKGPIPFLRKEDINLEAAEWVARLDRGLSATERVQLAEWLAADPARSALLEEMSDLWGEMDVLSELADIFPLDAASRSSVRTVARRTWTAGLAAAACLLLVLGGLWAARDGGLWDDFLNARPAIPDVAYETDIGEQESVDLDDGSTVTLNTDTSADVRFTDNSRDVFLKRGEAFFKVAHDMDRPFNVHVGDRVVQAVGTAFNVRLKEDGEVEVMVTEGRVRLMEAALPKTETVVAQPAPDRKAQTLGTFEVAVLDGNKPEFQPEFHKVAPAEANIKLAWRRGMLVFHGEPLSSVLQEVSRYTTTTFVLKDEALGKIRVGGYFQAGDIDGLLVALTENFDIQAQRVGKGQILLAAR